MYENSLRKLLYSLDHRNYKSYDPYDGNNTQISLLLKYRPVRIFNTYFHKFSPINFRRFFKIRQILSNQSAGLCLRGFINLKPGLYPKRQERIEILLNHIKSNTLYPKSNYYVWDGLNFPVQLLNSYEPYHDVTDIIAIETCGQALLDYYNKIDPDTELIKIFNSIIDYLLKYHQKNTQNFAWLKYHEDSNNYLITHNASILGAVVLKKMAAIAKREEEVENFCSRIVHTTLNFQKDDGRWNYSVSLETGYEKQQVDFHQGFILDALLGYMELTGFKDPFLSAYKKGLKFYYQKQFMPDGQSIYRYPKKWPADIHSQAQGIITFTHAARAGFGDHYLNFARTIAEWTIQNMQDKDGHFYFLKYPWFTNKIPYIRWSDANMAYALSVLLS